VRFSGQGRHRKFGRATAANSGVGNQPRYCSFTNDGEIRQWLGEPLRPSSIQVTLLTELAGPGLADRHWDPLCGTGPSMGAPMGPDVVREEPWVRTSRVGCFEEPRWGESI